MSKQKEKEVATDIELQVEKEKEVATESKEDVVIEATFSEFEIVSIEVIAEGRHKLTIGDKLEVSGNVANALLSKKLVKIA